MKLRHFAALRPICPACRRDASAEQPLRLGTVLAQRDDDIESGVLLCDRCMREFPIIDGIPVLVPDVRSWLASSVLHLHWRHDLPPVIDSLIGDCCGPGSAYDLTRQYLSTYAWGHYHDLDPAGDDTEPAVLGALRMGLDMALPAPDGLAVDLGCSVGRTTFALAESTGRLTVGMDLNFSMLSLARHAAQQGEVRYPLRRGGLVYSPRRFAVNLPSSALVDFWAADATCLPLHADTAALTSSLNLLDCLPAPYDHLAELARISAPGGRVVLGCPYDWSPAATDASAWIGGHSQRGSQEGSSARILRELLTPGALPHSIDGLNILAERPDVPWQVRVHDRSTMHYQIHLLAAEARS